MSEECREVQLTGGSPWGLRIQGGADFRAPLKVTSVTPGGKAALGGVQISDVIKQIGDRDCDTMRHSEALYRIRTSGASLSLLLQKGVSLPAPYQPPKQPVPVVPPLLSPVKVSEQVQEPVPAVEKQHSPARRPEYTGFERESVGGKDWYRAMHLVPQTSVPEEDSPHFSNVREEKVPPKPQPLKPKPRAHPIPSQTSLTLAPNTSEPNESAAPFSHEYAVPSDPVPQPPSPLLPTYQAPFPPPAHVTSADPNPPSADYNPPSADYNPPPVQSADYNPPSVQSADYNPPSVQSADYNPPSVQSAGGEAGKKRGKKRRELKPPPADWARGLYDFTAETKHELKFKKGDQLRLLRTVDENWLEAQLGANRGIIPVSYVQLDPSVRVEEEKSTPHAVARYDFAAEESYELAFSKGDRICLLSRVDENWIQGQVGDRTGIFPATFVEVLVPIEERQAQAPLAVPEPEQLIENEIRTRASVPPESAPEGELFRAVYSYAPQNSDELALEPGSEVIVVRKCEDGWYMGYNGDTGAFGTFPGNYVQPLP